MKLRSTIIGLATVFSILGSPLSASAQNSNEFPARVTDFVFTEAPDDHAIGSHQAATTLIIWASVTCSHCANWFTKEWPKVKRELVETGKLRVVLREFPTAPGSLSMAGFQLAKCAPSEDYFSIIEYQMQQQDNILKAAKEGRGAEAYRRIAELAGMKTNEAMASCLRNPDITAHIVDNANRAKLANIKGVPGLLINGQLYTGRQDAKTLIKLITEMDKKGISALPTSRNPADQHRGQSHK